MQPKTALLVIDVQEAAFDRAHPVYRAGELLETLSRLLARARAARVPVLFMQHAGEPGSPFEAGKPGWALRAAVRPQPAEPVLGKQHPDSFQGTALAQELERRGIRRLVIGGIQTEYCVDTTCRRAYSLGYEVILAADGHSTWDTPVLQAPRIIAHHNQLLGEQFVKLQPAGEIGF